MGWCVALSVQLAGRRTLDGPHLSSAPCCPALTLVRAALPCSPPAPASTLLQVGLLQRPRGLRLGQHQVPHAGGGGPERGERSRGPARGLQGWQGLGGGARVKGTGELRVRAGWRELQGPALESGAPQAAASQPAARPPACCAPHSLPRCPAHPCAAPGRRCQVCGADPPGGARKGGWAFRWVGWAAALVCSGRRPERWVGRGGR